MFRAVIRGTRTRQGSDTPRHAHDERTTCMSQAPQVPESANKGLEGIIACTTEISTIHDVTLLYRGYTIEDLAAQCGFEEVVYLLWNGNLPNQSQLSQFRQELDKSLTIPNELMPVLESIAKTNAHSMAKLR